MAASPDLLRNAALLRRSVTKFVANQETARALLDALRGEYAIVEAGTSRLATYRTLYFDTPDLRFLEDHRRGRRKRWKVRIRHYPDRDVAFLEIKRRISDVMNSKERRPVEPGRFELDLDGQRFVAEASRDEALLPQVWTEFRRVTLVAPGGGERLTVDLDLVFCDDTSTWTGGNLAVIELKQASGERTSAASVALRQRRVRRHDISKYCAAMLLLRPDLRAGRLARPLHLFTRGHTC